MEEDKTAYDKMTDLIACPLRLLHVLESNILPLWFNNCLVDYKGVSNDHFLSVEGWLGVDGF